MQPQPSHPFTSDLSGQEFWLLIDKGYTPLGLVLGNCVYSMGAMGGLIAGLKGVAGGEVGQYSKLMYDARELALTRMQAEAARLGADGVISVELKIEYMHGNEWMEITAVARRSSTRGWPTPPRTTRPRWCWT